MSLFFFFVISSHQCLQCFGCISTVSPDDRYEDSALELLSERASMENITRGMQFRVIREASLTINEGMLTSSESTTSIISTTMHVSEDTTISTLTTSLTTFTTSTSTTTTTTTTTTLVPCMCPNLNPPDWAPITDRACPVPPGYIQTRPMFQQVPTVPDGGQCAIQMLCEMYLSENGEVCVVQQNATTLIVCIAEDDYWAVYVNGVATVSAKTVDCLTANG